MQPKYHLADHVYACRTGRFCVFLDLNRDRYFSIPTDAFSVLEPQIHGCTLTQATSTESLRSPTSDEVTFLVQSLTAADVLRLNADPARLPQPVAITTPTSAVPSLSPLERRRQASWRDRVLVWQALLTAQYLLRARPLKTILSYATAPWGCPPRPAISDRRALSPLDLTLTFAAVRPLFPRNYLCLFDSLALVLYLARHGVRARWVFAVREDPFDAHCWVQTDTAILNDFADRVAAYTPIMVVPGA